MTAEQRRTKLQTQCDEKKTEKGEERKGTIENQENKRNI